MSPTTKEYEKGKVVGETYGCWIEMAGSLTEGKIFDLFKNLYLLPSSLKVFRIFWVLYSAVLLNEYLKSCG
jgi:hypothetical protein